MSYNHEMKRYGVINDSKEQSECVLLVGNGCTWRKCVFCDYQLDKSSCITHNFSINKKVLSQVTGEFGKLQVICSGSFAELDLFTYRKLQQVVKEKGITTLIFEGHWQHRDVIPLVRNLFKDIECQFTVGAETFDVEYRQNFMKKGMGNVTPEEIAQHFDRCNIMFGLEGQTLEQLQYDLETAVRLFKVVALNIFTPNTTSCRRDEEAIKQFYNSPLYEWAMSNTKIRVLDDLNRDKTDSFDLVGEKLCNIKEEI